MLFLPHEIFIILLTQGVDPALIDLGEGSTPLAANQTKIPYPKPLKHSNNKVLVE